MESEKPNRSHIVELYLAAPHILTDILYACSPTSFDALRYTCKAIYSMSLDAALLHHHLMTIVNRQHYLITSQPLDLYTAPNFDTKFDTAATVRGNLWRTRGMLLQEFLRMQSSWRIGECRKTVLELDVMSESQDKKFADAPFDGTVQVSLGTVRGDSFALMWSDKRKTILKTYRFVLSRNQVIKRIEGPDKLDISHNISLGKYDYSTFVSRGVGNRIPQMIFKMDTLNVNIYEGQYKKHPKLENRNAGWYYGSYFDQRPKEATSTLLRVNFSGSNSYNKYAAEFDDIDMVYQLNWEDKKAWAVPPVTLKHLGNVVLPDHSEESMRIMLGRDGKCTSHGYSIGIDDKRDRWTWRIEQPRRLELDVSRMGVWRQINIEFSKVEGEEPALAVTGTIARSLVNPNSTHRFLLTSSRTTSPNEWAKININLVLPPAGDNETRGKLVLASPTPAAYFRKLNMRDPEIPWEDPGFPMRELAVKTTGNTSEVLSSPDTMIVRTGCMLHSDSVDAEIVTRVVGWTEDGAVWVWDITEKTILNCGAQAPEPSSEDHETILEGHLDLPAKKLGYVKDVKGIAVTGDRLVQRIFLFTYGKELEVHRGGTLGSDGEENDSGISSLRREDILRGIARSIEKFKMNGKQISEVSTPESTPSEESIRISERDVDEATEQREDEEEEEEDKWRMVTYSFGDQMGNSGGFRVNPVGNLEKLW
ncbi:hypothetical protein ABW19_dt0206706 [Dactylella cylindrospora]|nr:hypothetical protein ABW19_dt0206706 [Dactylella cylindrospora]